jgi:hypothetical protein
MQTLALLRAGSALLRLDCNGDFGAVSATSTISPWACSSLMGTQQDKAWDLCRHCGSASLATFNSGSDSS